MALDEWACTVKTMVDNRIRKLKGQPQKTRKRQILWTAACVYKESGGTA